ncbi:MAG: acetyl-CoA carboxylase biotin carboxyl carrier protein [Pseudonocardiaceae bacterium]
MIRRPSCEPSSAVTEPWDRAERRDPVPAHELGTVLDQVRHHTTLLLSALPHPPRVLRVRAGDVAIDIEWDAAETSPAGPTHPEQPAPASDGDTRRVLSAQAVGVFYRAPEPGAEPFVREGDMVAPGQQVAIIEAMKLMIPVEADLTGRVLEVLKSDGEPVEYGEPLFALAPAEHW